MRTRAWITLATALLVLPRVAASQDAGARLQMPGVGEMAPDFELTGATRFGVLRDGVRLSELRGRTVVLAFFYRVRTPG